MEIINFTVGGRDYSASPLDAFTIATLWPKFIKKLGAGVAGDSDVTQALGNLDEEAMKTLIFPMLKKSAVACITESKKLASETDFNGLFNHENIFDFYLVVWEVIKINFSPLLSGLLSQFGLSLADLQQRVQQNLKSASSLENSAKM